MTRSCVINSPTLVQEHVAQYLRRLWHRDGHGPCKIGMAISGGVDSMALATLCRGAGSGFVFSGFIVDHGVRNNSRDEAAKVADELHRIGIEPRVLKLDWSAYGNPKDLTNFEAVARRLRYQAIGKACSSEGIQSLFVGHHADDQAETVLTRIVSGYLGAGLAGIQTEAGIPECAGIYGVDGSSGNSHRPEIQGKESSDQDGMPIEHGGVNICRPLLPFTKDTLIQICRDEDVKWFYDPTNADRMLTIRNTIRHLHEQAVLPTALQRSRLCSMALAAKTRTVSINGEVDQIFNMMDIELDLRLDRVIFTFDHDLIESCSPQVGETMHRIKAALLRKLMQLVTNRSILLQDLESSVEIVFPTGHHFHAMQVNKVNIQPAKSSDHKKSGGKTIVLSRQKPSKRDVGTVSEFAVLTQDHHEINHSTEWLLWDDRYWLRLRWKGHSESLASTSIFVRFFTPSILGSVRKNLNKEQRTILDRQLEAAKEYGLMWTLPVIVAREGDQEHVISLPTLRWENPAFRKHSTERAGDTQLHFQLDIRYKSVDFACSGKHRIVS